MDIVMMPLLALAAKGDVPCSAQPVRWRVPTGPTQLLFGNDVAHLVRHRHLEELDADLDGAVDLVRHVALEGDQGGDHGDVFPVHDDRYGDTNLLLRREIDFLRDFD